MTTQNEKRSLRDRLWKPGRRWLLYLPLGAFLMALTGGFVVAGFNASMHYTNQNSFCFSCHLGMDTIVEEYLNSPHGKNSLGIVASCSDCHVPTLLIPKLITKIKASKDLYHTLIGTYTLENFESHRTELAMQAREALLARGSDTCKTCHNPEAWDLVTQSERAKQSHDPSFWQKNNRSCVNCHFAVAHRMPR